MTISQNFNRIVTKNNEDRHGRGVPLFWLWLTASAQSLALRVTGAEPGTYTIVVTWTPLIAPSHERTSVEARANFKVVPAA